MDVSCVEYLMNHEFSVPFTVGHTAKEVYWCVSKYTSITLIITDVKHLVEWCNIQHTAPPPQTNAKYQNGRYVNKKQLGQ